MQEDNILIILDGLDVGNAGAIEVFSGAKCRSCCVLGTSRAHNIKVISPFCDTLVQIDPFDQSKAKQYAERICSNDKQVEDILSFQPFGEEKKSLHSHPSLLCGLSYAVKMGSVPLSNRTEDVGFAVLKLTPQTYKTYKVKRNKSYNPRQFSQVLMSSGKLGFKMLLTGRYTEAVQRSYVFKIMDEKAFDYGILVGDEESPNLEVHETADIEISYLHESIQILSAAFYFVISLSEEKSLDDLVSPSQMPLLTGNQLFLKFCLWFLYCSDDEYLVVPNNAQLVGKLQKNYQFAEAFQTLASSDEKATTICEVKKPVCSLM